MTPIATAAWLAEESLAITPDWHGDIRRRALARGQHDAWKPSPRWHWTVLLLVLALTLAALLMLRAAMHPQREGDTGVLHVILIDAAAPEPVLPEPEARSRPALVTAASSRPEPSASFRISETSPASTRIPGAESMLRVFNADGSIRLPASPKLQGHDADIARGRELLARGHNLLHCRPGRFDSGSSPGETANKAAGGLAMYLTMFQSPSGDPQLREVGAAQQIAAVREIVAAKLVAAQQACDDQLYGPPRRMAD